MVVRQDRETRRFVVLGDLIAEADGTFTFTYRPEARRDPEFRPVPGFPDPHLEYRSPELFPFFTNRVMSPRRPDFGSHLRAIGLDSHEATPVQMLVRTGGRRATDTYLVVPEPTVDTDGTERRLFLATGIRHLPGAPERVSTLSTGQELELRTDPTNEYDRDAILLDAASNEPVGFVPGYMCRYVRDHRQAGRHVRVVVVQANGPDVPRHLQLLCRMEVIPPTGPRR